MSSFGGFTEKQWYGMCSCNMSLPVPLHKANITKPFVYDRKFGLFYVPFGYHQSAMSLLLAWQLGLDKGVQVVTKLKIAFSSETADYWLENTPGAAFKSSISYFVQAARPNSLNAIERRIFGEICYIY